jgi:hypothetical protein
MSKNTIKSAQTTVPTHLLVGSVHRFGAHGVIYEVKSAIDENNVLIRVIETGEETTYPADAVRKDPIE